VLDEFERELVTDLMPDEVRESAKTAADKQDEVDRLTLEKKSIGDRFKGQIEEAETEKRKMLREVRTEKRKKLTKCERRLVMQSRTVSTVRTDTGEVLDTRPARDEEMQRTLIEIPKTTMEEGATLFTREEAGES
jgi:hypothetical protein